VDADRNRIGEFEPENFDTLNQKAEALRQMFQERFDGEFAIEDEGNVYGEGFATIMQSEVGEAVPAAATDVQGDATAAEGRVQAEVDADNRTGIDAPGDTAGDANRNDPGRNIASVRIAESHGLPEL